MAAGIKKKLLFGVCGIFGLLSLIANYAHYRSRNNSVINGGNAASFFDFGNSTSFKVDGCVLWTDEKNRSEEFRQYWKVNAIVSGRNSTCKLTEATQMRNSVIVADPEDCEIRSFDSTSKTATIAFKDAVITVNRDRTIWTTSNPDEKGGGELVPCWDKRLNWYFGN